MSLYVVQKMLVPIFGFQIPMRGNEINEGKAPYFAKKFQIPMRGNENWVFRLDRELNACFKSP